MKTTIKNFTGSEAIEIDPHVSDSGATVMIRQRGGSMYFQMNFTAADARLMADALLAAADEIEEAIA